MTDLTADLTMRRIAPKLDHERVSTFEGLMPPGRPGRLASAAGEMVRFADGEDSYHFAVYWDCLEGGPCRGNHYHHDKTEVMYVISGRLQAAYYDLDTHERIDMELVGGDLVVVRPRLVHAYVARQYTQVVEVATHAYNPQDTYPHVLL